MYDIIIVGAGTAGMSAAIYGLRNGKSVLLLEEKSYGGQIINTPEVENYPGMKNVSGFEFATNLYNQIIALGAEIIYAKVIEIQDKGAKKTVVTNDNVYECGSVIIATGATNRLLGLEKEQQFIGAGVSYCATCDGAFFKGKDVAIVGGGNAALEDATFLSNFCDKVYLVHRREKFRGEDRMLERLREKENVIFVLNSVVTEILGENKVEGIMVHNKETGRDEKIVIAGLFVAIGRIPQNEEFRNLIQTDENGYIHAGENCRTNIEGIFTAGDCRTKQLRQLTTAASDGAVAAMAACEYLEIK